MRVIGNIDKLGPDTVEGWITVQDMADLKCDLEFVQGGDILGRCLADRFRKDLADANLADGRCAFVFEIPAFLPKSEIANIRVKLSGSDVYLGSRLPAEKSSGNYRRTVSRFGGLWIDCDDWLDQLALKHRCGEISDEISTQIFKFVRDGYLVLPGAVAVSDIDNLNREIEEIWKKPPLGMRVETFEPDGKMRVVAPEVRLRPGRTKMLDLYAHSATARSAIAAKPVVTFLSAIFEDAPKAFQGLTFWNGSQQAIHKDTAYVKVDSNPMNLAATWLALEDIAPGTGELEYFVGSHRAPDFLFGGKHKWMETNTSEHDRFLASLHEDAEKYHHRKASFLGRKGDVLIWHADLAHGGSPIANKSGTRRSLVTHFTGRGEEPFYRRNTQYKDAKVSGCYFVSQYCDIFSNPNSVSDGKEVMRSNTK